MRSHDAEVLSACRTLGAGDNGWLLLTMLRVDRRMVAFSFGFDHRDVVYGLEMGYDERHAKLSPGLQLMHRTLDLAQAGLGLRRRRASTLA